MIHNSTGGVMVDIPYASWDPIFWLHHCNVDRVLQAWYKKTYKNIPDDIVDDIKTVSKVDVTQRYGPFYGELKNPTIDIDVIHKPVYFTYQQMIQDTSFYQYNYDNIDWKPFDGTNDANFQRLALSHLVGPVFHVVLTHLTRAISMNINIYIIPVETDVNQNNYRPLEEEFAGALGIFGGNKNKGCINCLKKKS